MVVQKRNSHKRKCEEESSSCQRRDLGWISQPTQKDSVSRSVDRRIGKRDDLKFTVLSCQPLSPFAIRIADVTGSLRITACHWLLDF